MSIESICVEGGEIHLKEDIWQMEPGQIEHVIVPPAEITVRQGVCPRPIECRLSQGCTGKVMFTTASESGFSKAIVHSVMLSQDNKINRDSEDNPIFAIYRSIKEVLK